MPTPTDREAPAVAGASTVSDETVADEGPGADVDGRDLDADDRLDLDDVEGTADAGRDGLDDDGLGPDDDAAVTGGGESERRTGRFGTIALTIAVVVGLLLGFGAGWLAPRLTTPGDASAEAGFARDMINHHAQAVDMGLIAFQRGESPAVRQLGVDIATGQQGEIGMMQTWLRQWRLEPTGSQPAMAWMPDAAGLSRDGLMPGMASAVEMRQLRAASGEALDIMFLQLMIRHHLGGIHMIDAALAASDEPEVVQAAQTMKNVQQNDLTNMRADLATLGGTALPAN